MASDTSTLLALCISARKSAEKRCVELEKQVANLHAYNTRLVADNERLATVVANQGGTITSLAVENERLKIEVENLNTTVWGW